MTKFQFVLLISSFLSTLSFAGTLTPGNTGKTPKLWLRADKGVTQSSSKVSRWNDQSGSGNHQYQATAKNKPDFQTSEANFNPTIYFSGNQWLADPDGILVTGVKYDATQMFVVHRSEPTTNRGLCGQYFWNNDLVENGRYIARGEESGTQNFGIKTNDNLWLSISPGSEQLNSTAINTYNVVKIDSLGGTQNLWFNGGLNTHNLTSTTYFENPGTTVPWVTGAAPGEPSYTTDYSSPTFYKQVGTIPELIVYDQTLTEVERLKIETYLAIKYGTTLLHNYYNTQYDGTNAATTTIYDISTYGNNIAGMGREDAEDLFQKQSCTSNSDVNSRMVIMGLSTIAGSNAANWSQIIDDKTYLVWGDDNGAATETTDNIPTGTGTVKRLARQWKIQATNSIVAADSIEVYFDLQNATFSATSISDFKLLCDRDGDGDFTTGTIDTYDADPSSSIYGVTFKNVEWDGDSNGTGQDVFALQTLGSSTPPPPSLPTLTPGNTGVHPALWLRADKGVTQSSGKVSQWDDQSGYLNHHYQATSGNQPDFQTSEANFNPNLYFSGNQWVADPDGIVDSTNHTGAQVFIIHKDESMPQIRSLYGQYVTEPPFNSSNKSLRYMGVGEGDGNLVFGIRTVTGDSPANEWLLIPAGSDRMNANILNTFNLNNGTLNLWFNGGENANTPFNYPGFTSLSTTTPWTVGAGPVETSNNDQPTGFKHTGTIPELIVYNQTLTEVQRLKIETYLAIKYGSTLLHNYYNTQYDGTNAATTTVYDISNYGNNIAGMGREDVEDLFQKQSRSQNSVVNSGMVTMGLSTIAASNAANWSQIITDGTYMVWGDDSVDVTETTSDIPTGTAKRLAREWKIQATNSNWPDSVVVNFDLSNATVSATSISDFKLLCDRDGDGDFTTGTIDTYDADPSSTLTSVTFKNVDWDGDNSGKDVFALQTLGTPLPTLTPGNTGVHPALWLRADKGVTQSSGKVSQWDDQSGYLNHHYQATSGNQPDFQTSEANFNPNLYFSGNQWVADPNGLLNTKTKYTGAQVFIIHKDETMGAIRTLYGQYVTNKRNVLNLPGIDSTVYKQSLRYMGCGEVYGNEMFGIRTITYESPANEWLTIPAGSDRMNANILNTFNLNNGTLNLWFNGGENANTPFNFPDFTGWSNTTPWTVGAGPAESVNNDLPTAFKHTGTIPEIIVYNQTLTEVERLKIETYLAIKYGSTLLHNYYNTLYDGTNAATTMIYNISTYENNIAGIGREDAEDLNQKQSRSQNSLANSRMVTMGVDTIATSNTNNAGTVSDNAYLVWGDDNGDVTESTSDVPSAGTKRIAREWKIQRTGTAPATTVVNFDLSGLTFSGTSVSDYKLLVDRDGDGNFTTGKIDKYSADPMSTLTSLKFKNVQWDKDANGQDVFTLQSYAISLCPVLTITATPNDTVCACSKTTLQAFNDLGGGVLAPIDSLLLSSNPWRSADTKIATVDKYGVVTGVKAGVVKITYKLSATSACPDSTSITLTVGAKPSDISTTVTQPTCAVTSGTVLLKGLPAGQWTLSTVFNSGSPLFTTGNTATNTITGLAPGNYSFSVQNSTGCSSSTTKIVINQIPSPPSAPSVSAQSFCVSATVANLPQSSSTSVSSVAQSSSSGSSSAYIWYAASLVGSPLSGSVTLQSGTYYVSSISGGCESSRTAVIVTINQLPSIQVTPPSATIESGSSVALVASGASTYTWSPISGLSSSTSASVIAKPSATTTYRVTGKASTGCTNTASVTVIVNPVATCNATVSKLSSKVTGTSAALSWTSSNASSYKVEYKLNTSSISAGWIVATTSSKSLTLTGLAKSTKYSWRVTPICGSGIAGNAVSGTDFTTGKTTTKSIEIDGGTLTVNEAEPELKVYPNPFREKLNFDFTAGKDSHALLEIYDVRGRKLETIYNEKVYANQKYTWEYFPTVSTTGVLFYRLILDDQAMTGKVLSQY